MKRIFLILLLTSISSRLWATIKLPALVGDNMVLQRDAKINLWGWADPGENVYIQFRGKHFQTKTDKDGKWTLVLPPFSYGGPYQMVIKGKNSITLQNILVGDVWLASGQSNMEWVLNTTNNSEKEIQTANFPQIRLFNVVKKFAFQPDQDIKSNGWTECTPETVKFFSAVAFLYGRELYKHYNVPIGLIESAWGGTPAQAWTSKESLKPLPAFSKLAEEVSRVHMTEFDAFKKKKETWMQLYGAVDRGRLPGQMEWSDVNLNTSDWLTMKQPCKWSDFKDLKAYSGIIWFRKEVEIPSEAAGKPMELNLGIILLSDSVFFNGQLVGSGSGFEKKRQYQVPASLVKTGRNLIAVRVKGMGDYSGILGPEADMYIQAGGNKIPLAGDWLYKTGPDISGMPYDALFSTVNPFGPQTSTLIFNSMIAPLIPYSIKGVIWYQGEANADGMEGAQQYYTLFPAMINDWRQRWGYNFPFLYVQLAGFQPDKTEPADYPWARLREAQFKTLALPNTGMATAIDIGEEYNIHPRNKQDVAHRLALTAEKIAYNENVVYSGPTVKGINIEGDKIRLTFENVGSGLWAKDKYGYLRGFAISGEDKKFTWAKAYQDGNDVVVYSESIKKPVAVRYDWGNSPDGNLYNKEELPALPFRTDDW
ncbi:MAG: 9-O-acetylesterase [Bacteroidetes bacterium]|nr:9-O-acetylesterase [Bacteroidota bacterium]